MSKTHSKENSLFSDLASTTIAGQLESRLRELERNIAVAHEFIKLADESYNQVKHEWELLHDDTSPSKKTSEFPSFSPPTQHDDEDTFEDIPSFKDKKKGISIENPSKSFSPTPSHAPSLEEKPKPLHKKKKGPESSDA